MSKEYEAERAISRDDVATALRRLADGVAAGSVAVDAEAGPVAVDVPADLTFEVELEAEDAEVELEVELEWLAGETDVSAISELDAGDGSAAGEGAESTTAPDAESTNGQNVESAVDLPDLIGPATGADAPVDEPASKATFELFRDAADEWRWRLRHRNGNVIADSGEGYDRKADAVNGLESVKGNAPGAVVEEESE